MTQPIDPQPPTWANAEFRAWLSQLVKRCVDNQLRAEREQQKRNQK